MRKAVVGACIGCGMLLTAAPACAQPSTNWNGFYVGVNLGAGWGESKFGGINDVPLFPAFSAPTSSGTIDVPASNGTVGEAKGNDVNAIGGGQFGFNWQNGNLVFGAEADYDGGAIRSDGVGPGTPTGGNTNPHFGAQLVNAHYFTKMDWLGSLRARLGFVQDYLMVYATGGLALAHAGIQTSFVVVNSPAIIPSGATSILTTNDSGMHTGWTVGAGAEFALSRRWSLAAEYRYSDYGSQTYDAGIAHADFASSPRMATKMRLTADQVTLRLNIRLGG